MNRDRKGNGKGPIERVELMEAMIRCFAQGVVVGGFIVAFAYPLAFRFKYPDASETRLFLMAWPYLAFGLFAMMFGYWALVIFEDKKGNS